MPDGYDEHMRLLDIPLTTLAAARLSRLVITDDLGAWWIKEPIDRAMNAYAEREIWAAANVGQEPHEPWWWKYRSGLDCKWCVGYWAGVVVLGTRSLARGRRGEAAWRFVAGTLALNYAAALLANLEEIGQDDGNDAGGEDL